MHDADAWLIARHGFVETARAVGLVSGKAAVRAFEGEWPSFTVIELDQSLCENAVKLAFEHGLRSPDALHLAAALLLPRQDLVFATWDRRLMHAAEGEGLEVIPAL
jgi:predicted nucleic acid-binding protein